MHRLLKQQIKTHFGEEIPSAKVMQDFIEVVNISYMQFQDKLKKIELEAETIKKQTVNALQDSAKNDLNGEGGKIYDAPLLDNNILLQAINKAAAELLGNRNFNEAIGKSIQIVGSSIDLDRVQIFEHLETISSGSKSFSQRFEWKKENNDLLIDHPEMHGLDYETLGLKRWQQELGANRVVKGIVKDLPVCEQKSLIDHNLVSFMAVPIFILKNFWGFISFDDCSKQTEWTLTEEQMLRNFTNNIGAAFESHYTERKLKENEEKFRLLIESATDIFYYTDEVGNFTYVNNIATQITGFSNDELLKMNYLDLVEPAQRSNVESFYRKQSLLGNKVTYNEFPINTKNGKTSWIGQNVQLIVNANKTRGIQAIARDITSLKNAQLEIENSHNFLNEIVDSIPSPLFVKNRQHQWVLVNNAYSALTGIPKSKIIGQTDYNFLTKADAADFIAFDEKQFIEKSDTEREITFVNAENTNIILLVKKSHFVNQDKEFIISVITDITEIKEREKEIVLYNNISNQISDAISVADTEGSVLYVNQSYAQSIGKSKEELIGTSILDVENQFGNISHWKQYFNEIKSKGELLIEGINTRTDGTRFPVEASVKYVNIDGKDTIVSAFRDITERKKTEDKLIQSENRFRSVVQNATDITTLLSIEGIINYESPSFYRVFNYSEGDVYGKSVFDFIHPDDTEYLRKQFTGLVKNGGVSDTFQYRFRKKDGAYLYIESVGNNLLHEPGIQGIVVNSRDISERLKAELANKEMKEFYETLINKIPSDVVVFDNNYRYVFINEIAVKDPEIRNWMIGHDNYEYCEHFKRPVSIAHNRQALFEKVSETKNQVEFEENLKLPDGNHRWFLRKFYPVLDKDNNILNIIGFGVDITKRKEVEIKIQESEERLSLAIKSANLGIWDWNLTDDDLLWDPSMYTIFNVDPKEFSSDLEAFESTIHPDDSLKVKNGLAMALKGGYDFKDVYRVIDKEKEIKYISSSSKTFRYDDGTPYRIIGVNFDITEATLIEQTIMKQQHELEEAQHIARLGGWEIDVKTRTIIWSKEMYNICEIDSNVKKPTLNETYEMYTPDTREGIIQGFFNAIDKQESFELEAKIVTQKKKLIDVRTKGVPFIEDGKVHTIRGIFQDITEEKNAKLQMELYTQELEKKNKELDQFAYIVSHDLKAPLRGINNLSMWIEEDMEGKMEADTKTNLDLMRKRVKRMEGLIDGILQYSRAGRIKHESSVFKLKTALDELVESLSAPEKLKIIIPETLPVMTAEKIAIEQIFSNYISNGIKYNNNPEPTIEISFKQVKDFYEFCVADNGPGIQKEFHEKVFVIFQTLQARDTFESTGVGLAIVKKIVEDKGGRVWIESEMGKGTKFFFSWPITEID
ncbi:MAG: PAS domain S-box protein [Bacteroidia bacterium]|nr:PAS domain S-box protein [Bacteroidia bacterium]